MASLPYLQFYVSDWRADTSHLTLEQKGAYLELILLYWESEKALNNSDDRLASSLKISKRRFQTMKKLLSEFFTVKDDIWTHGRIEADLEKVFNKSKKRSYAGQESARKRANDKATSVEQNPTSVEQVSIYIDKDRNIDIDNRQEKIMVIKDDPINDPDFKVFWMAYPKKVKKAPAAKSYAKALKKATPDEIFKGLVTYSRTCGTDPKFIANPDSWLNQERWNDINPQPKVEGSHSQSSNQFEASEATPTPPKFTIEDVKAPTKPFKSWRELAGESE